MKKQNKLVVFALLLGIGLFMLLHIYYLGPILKKRAEAVRESFSQPITPIAGPFEDATSFLTALANVDIIVPGAASADDPEGAIRVKLENSRAQFKANDKTGTVRLAKVLGTKSFDNYYDIFCELVVDYGDGQEVNFVSVFALDAYNITQTSSVSIGNSVEIDSVVPQVKGRVSPYDVEVIYFDRAPGEPLASAPTLKHELTFTVRSHKIIEP